MMSRGFPAKQLTLGKIDKSPDNKKTLRGQNWGGLGLTMGQAQSVEELVGRQLGRGEAGPGMCGRSGMGPRERPRHSARF